MCVRVAERHRRRDTAERCHQGNTGEGVLLRPLEPGVPVRFEEVIGCYPGVAEQIVVHGKDLGA